MRCMSLRFVALALLMLSARRDLDVGVPAGSPLDFVRIPVSTESMIRRDVATPSRKGGGPGVTQAKVEHVPLTLPSLSRPLTLDFANHLRWRPSKAPGTPTGAMRGKLAGYPPAYPQSLYHHCISHFLMLKLHPDKVSPREVLSYLIEIGEPAAHAATAIRGESKALQAMAKYVWSAAGLLPVSPPRGPFKSDVDKGVAAELVVAFPYGPDFGGDFLKLPPASAVATLSELARSTRHRFMARNALFSLRLYDHPSALPVLRDLLKSRDKVVRNRALAALIRWRDPDVVPWLILQLSATDLPFRSYALHALGKIGDRRAVEPILRRLKRSGQDWEFVWGALAALARIRDRSPEVLETLDKVEKVLPLMRLVRVRRTILQERVRIARAYLGDPDEQDWLGIGVYVQPANQRLAKEWIETERRKMKLARRPAPKPVEKPGPPRKPEPAPPPPPDPAIGVADDVRSDILVYTGVRSVRAEAGTVRVAVETEADAFDLRVLLGSLIRGVRLLIDVEP